MYVQDVTALLRFYAQEPSVSNLMSTTNIQRMLEFGYRKFRSKVQETDPTVYATTVDLTWSNQRTYNLATGTVKLLGASASPRMAKLLMVYEFDATDGSPTVWYDQVTSLHEVTSAPGPAVALIGQVLWSWVNLTTTLRLQIVAESTVSFAAGAQAGGNIYIDDLGEYHDLIALYALSMYEGADGFSLPQHQLMRQNRELELQDHLLERSGTPARMGTSAHSMWPR